MHCERVDMICIDFNDSTQKSWSTQMTLKWIRASKDRNLEPGRKKLPQFTFFAGTEDWRVNWAMSEFLGKRKLSTFSFCTERKPQAAENHHKCNFEQVCWQRVWTSHTKGVHYLPAGFIFCFVHESHPIVPGRKSEWWWCKNHAVERVNLRFENLLNKFTLLDSAFILAFKWHQGNSNTLTKTSKQATKNVVWIFNSQANIYLQKSTHWRSVTLLKHQLWFSSRFGTNILKHGGEEWVDCFASHNGTRSWYLCNLTNKGCSIPASPFVLLWSTHGSCRHFSEWIYSDMKSVKTCLITQTRHVMSPTFNKVNDKPFHFQRMRKNTFLLVLVETDTARTLWFQEKVKAILSNMALSCWTGGEFAVLAFQFNSQLEQDQLVSTSKDLRCAHDCLAQC